MLQIPDGFDIFTAQFARGGDDLVIAAEGSPPLTVVGYFTASTAPALVAPNGAMLTGDVVELLAGSRAPAQYAQADAPEGASPIGKVEVLTGTSTATRATGEVVELAQDDPVFLGDVLATGADSTLGVRLEDGTLASMSAQSRLVLNEFVYEVDGSSNWMLVNLVEGAFAFLTGAIAPSGGMEITTPVAVMAIRGTLPIAIVAAGGASQFFAGSDETYELLHLTTRELLAVIRGGAGYSLGSPNATLQTIDIDPETLNEINNLLDVLNDAAASLGLLGILAGSGFHTYSPFGSIGDVGAYGFLQLLAATLAEEAVIEIEEHEKQDPQLVALPDQAATVEMVPIVIDVLANDSHPLGGELTLIFAAVPNGQGTVTITDDQLLVYDPGSAFEHLELGETADVVITYAIRHESGAITSSTATVTVTGINQAPVIVPVADIAVDEQTDTDPLQTTVVVNFTDVDLNSVGHAAEVTGVEVDGDVDGLTLDNLELLALLAPGTVTKIAGEGGGSAEFNFSAGSTVFDYLAVGDTVTLIYTVEIDDQDGGVTPHTFNIVVTGTNDAPVIHVELSDVEDTVVEEGLDDEMKPVGNPDASGQIDASDVDNGGLTFSFLPASGVYGTFAIGATGAWTYVLNDAAADHLALGESATDQFTVTVKDSVGATDEVLVTLTVTGSNDAPVVSDVDLVAVEDGPAVTGSFVGDDVDSDDDAASLVYTVEQPAEGTVINNVNGTFSFDPGDDFQDLAAGETRDVTFTYTATDRHGVVSEPATITVKVTGVGDVPVIGGVSTGAVTEDADPETLTTGGTLTIADPDAGQSNFAPQPSFEGDYGTFTLSADGTWTYSADNTQGAIQSLGAGDKLTDSFTAVSSDGTASQEVTVTIHGTNDVPVIGGVATGAVTEDADPETLTTGGTLTIADVDAGESNFAPQASFAGTYGTFTLAADGTWTYSADNTQGPIQALGADDELTDSFTAVSSDSTASQVVTVTIHGTNDGSEIGGVATGAVTEDADPETLTTGGALTIADPDAGQSNFAPQAATLGNNGYGTFTLLADGTWTYSADNTQGAIQSLGAGDKLTDSFTAVSSDGTASQVVTVTIHGTNDVPEIGGVATGAVTEDADPETLTTGGELTISDPDAGQSTFEPQASAAGTYGMFTLSADGTWTYSASNTQSAIQELGEGDELTDSFTAESSDGTASQVVTVTIHGTNDLPVVDLNGAAPGSDNAVTFTENEGPVAIAALGELSDVDSETLQSMTVTLSDVPDGEHESLALTAQAQQAADDAGLDVSYDSNTGVLSITGTASLAVYQTVLRGIVYENSSQQPDSSDREITVVVNDGDDTSTVATTTVEVVPVADPISFAILTVDDPNSNEYGSGDLGTQHLRLFAIVGDGDQTLEPGETAFRLSNNLNSEGGLLVNNDANDPVIISSDGPLANGGFGDQTNSVTFANETGFGLDDLGGNALPTDAYLNDRESLTFQLTGGLLLAVVAFTVNALDASADVTIDVDGSIADDGYSLGTLNDGDKVVIDFVNQTITVNGDVLDGTAGFFTAAAGTDAVTIGSSSTGGDGFSIQDLQLTPKEATGDDPIVLDLGEPGFDLSATAAFDLDADGEPQMLAWPSGGDGILAMDLDGSGAIENGSEVFSPDFGEGGHDDALDALASLDVNGDNVLDAEDEAFADLLAWIDANGDGISQPGELVSLADLGIVSLDLATRGVAYTIDGQTVIAEGGFTNADGSTGQYVAVELNEVLTSPEPLVAGNDGGRLFELTDLSIHDVIADYRAGDVIDLTRLGFEVATGQFTAAAAKEFVSYDSAESALYVDADGSGGPSQFVLAAEFATAQCSIMVRLCDGTTTADVEIA